MIAITLHSRLKEGPFSVLATPSLSNLIEGGSPRAIHLAATTVRNHQDGYLVESRRIKGQS